MPQQWLSDRTQAVDQKYFGRYFTDLATNTACKSKDVTEDELKTTRDFFIRAKKAFNWIVYQFTDPMLALGGRSRDLLL